MSNTRYYRAKAEFCFGIAQVLSDPIAAERTRALANDCVRRAQELETGNGDKSTTSEQLSPLREQRGRSRQNHSDFGELARPRLDLD
jgi:hypothetical protein